MVVNSIMIMVLDRVVEVNITRHKVLVGIDTNRGEWVDIYIKVRGQVGDIRVK